jgi:hypothetical protein
MKKINKMQCWLFEKNKIIRLKGERALQALQYSIGLGGSISGRALA